ncbi:hypothetical protein QP020_04920 [Gallibacterium anatis]|nr:hypothetical protein [Gallibacterium anatis]WIM85356.1 hypothetical protein QP020_04920 [Gallibacterium anatis]
MKKSFNETTFRQGKLFYKVWANKATTNVDKYKLAIGQLKMLPSNELA